jgi:glycine/D-amino acid oxidase-like deaminating enzyme/SAM-dependent methyltransferase
MGETEKVSEPWIILGAGLAGTTLAWQCYRRGIPFDLIDRNRGDGASRVAAGLISPLTGQRLVEQPGFAESLRIAEAHYRSVEAETGKEFFDQLEALYLLETESDRARFPAEKITSCPPFAAPHGMLLREDAAILDTQVYLDASRDFFRSRRWFVETVLPVPDGIQLTANGVRIDRLELDGSKLIFCQGPYSEENPWFEFLKLEQSMGEVLLLRIPELNLNHALHFSGYWIFPFLAWIPLSRASRSPTRLIREGSQRDDWYLLGSTYRNEWGDLNATEEARTELLQALGRVLNRPVEVLSQSVGLRPLPGKSAPHPVGWHPHYPQLGIFNGLGSKGCLSAPVLAQQFFAAEPLMLKIPSEQPKIRPTEEVHRLLKETLQAGEIAIDATVGNGNDTRFLAELVGPTGTVFGFDIQKEAITRTRRNVPQANVQLLQENHARIGERFATRLTGRVGAIVFNLGYLPRGDHTIITRPESTRQALQAAIPLLRPDGILTVVCYLGHPGGAEEMQEVRNIFATLLDRFEVQIVPADMTREDAPWLFVARAK